MQKRLIFLIPIIVLIILAIILRPSFNEKAPVPQDLWEIKSVDTMKFSRDKAAEKLDNPNFDAEIEKQINAISLAGATHVAIATPYDQKFVPMLERWVRIAREHKLQVWFRGNFSGWEGWFEYPKISRAEHLKLLEEFIVNNPTLFEDNDIFTPCPECENGGPGDPRTTRDISGYRNFLKQEFEVSNRSFGKINKKLKTGYFSMNYDVAKLIMDKETTLSLGGIVVIDHYTSSSDRLLADVKFIHNQTQGKVILGEFGAPIPDIHGKLTKAEQADWINQALEKISHEDYLVGINYWTGFGGSTAIWNDDGSPLPAVAIIQKFFSTKVYKTQP